MKATFTLLCTAVLFILLVRTTESSPKCRECIGDNCKGVDIDSCIYGWYKGACGPICYKGPGAKCSPWVKCGKGLSCMCGQCSGCSLETYECYNVDTAYCVQPRYFREYP